MIMAYRFQLHTAASGCSPTAPGARHPPRGLIQLQLCSRIRCRRGSDRTRRHHRFLAVSCKSGGAGSGDHLLDGDFLLASLLVPETVAHYRMRRRAGFKEEGVQWGPPPVGYKPYPFPARKEPRHPNPSSSALGLGIGFLSRFKFPTIFLKVSCDGDFLLPIIVGEFAVEKLIDVMLGDNHGDFPDHYQLAHNIVAKLGYQVKMVRITERVANTYFARLYIGKPDGSEVLSVDVRPSDAINVAKRCKAPIYVSKEIVFMDAIGMSYGMGRLRQRKPTYDVSLDSADEGPDVLAEELHLVRNMNLAVKEERYRDAASWRDKLMEFRKSKD